MKNTYILVLFISILFQTNLFAQEDVEQSLLDDFDEIVNKSNNYEDYKVVKKLQLKNFRNSLSKELESLENEIEELRKLSEEKDKKITELQSLLDTSEENLRETTAQRDQIIFFGAPMEKATYQTTMWGVIGVLILILILFLLKFKSNNSSTNEAKKQLGNVEKEFEEYKRKALEKQQKLGRELQDQKNLVNKLKGNKQ